MRKLISLLLASAMIFTFASCSGKDGKKDDKNDGGELGTYNGVYTETFGEAIPLTEIFEGNSCIILKADNKCDVTIDGDTVPDCSWKKDGDDITITATVEGETEEMSGTLKDGVLTIDLMGSPIVFAKEGADVEIPTGSVSDDEPTEDTTDDELEFGATFPSEEQMARYRGDWNGAVGFRNCTGMYEYLNGTNATAIARFLIDDWAIVTPFIGLNVQDTPINELSAYIDPERDALVISGKWIEVYFSDVPSIELGGTVSFTVPISNDYGSVEMIFNFRRLDDEGWTDEDPGLSKESIEYCRGMSFDELAELNGYAPGDYPTE